jgi:hypothetical protein
LKNSREVNAAAWIGPNGHLNNPAMKVDSTPIVDQLNATLKSPIGRDTAVNRGLKSVISDINEIAGEDGAIDVGNLDAIRQKLRDTIAQHTSNGFIGSKTDAGLNPIRNAITDQIESTIPGYRSYLAQYGNDSRKINTMEAANSFSKWVGGRPLLDPDGTPSISYQQTAKQLNDILTRDGGVDPELENAVKAMHSDMQRGTVVAMSQKQAGSDSLANFSARGRMHAVLGLVAKKTLPGGIYDMGEAGMSQLFGQTGIQSKQVLAKMMADPRYAADIIDSMGPKL